VPPARALKGGAVGLGGSGEGALVFSLVDTVKLCLWGAKT